MLKFYWYNFSSGASSDEIITQINEICEKTKHLKRMEDIMLFVCIPTELLETVAKSIEDKELVKLCSQCFCAGNISGMPSAEQLHKIGIHAGIAGLTDRRAILGETNEFCRDSLGGLLSIGMKGLLCVGETSQMKQRGIAKDIVSEQVRIGLSKVPEDAVYRMGIMYRPMWEFDGEKTDLKYGLEMIDVIKKASFDALPDLPEPLPVFYGGNIDTKQLKELFSSQTIDGIFTDSRSMTSDELIQLINKIGK